MAILPTFTVIACLHAAALPCARAAAMSDGQAAGAPAAEKRESDPAPPPTDDTIKAASWFVWQQHPTLTFENLRLDFEATLHEDLHASYDGAGVAAGLTSTELRRARVGVRGAAFGHFTFEIERELTANDLSAVELAAGETADSRWKDVNVDIDYTKAAQVRVGRFKIPFGLDQLTGIAHHDFVYRSLGAEYLAPARDVGIMLHGRLRHHLFGYSAGVFRHDGDNARSPKIQGGDGTYAVRITAQPMAGLRQRSLGHLEAATAFALSRISDESFRPNGLRGHTVVTDDTFFPAVYVNGHRRRWEGDLEWGGGGATVRSEYTYVTDDRIGQGIAGEDLPDARYRAYYVSGTYLVTGERKERPLAPRHPFLQGGAGAFEVAARFERLWCDSVGGGDAPFRNPRAAHIMPNGDRVVTFGVNWMLNRWITFQLNAIREAIDDPERSPVAGGGTFWSRVLRLRLGV